MVVKREKLTVYEAIISAFLLAPAEGILY